jgi:hypothetical protein
LSGTRVGAAALGWEGGKACGASSAASINLPCCSFAKPACRARGVRVCAVRAPRQRGSAVRRADRVRDAYLHSAIGLGKA